jgi:hypothetical protein
VRKGRAWAVAGVVLAAAPALAYDTLGYDWTWYSDPVGEDFEVNSSGFPSRFGGSSAVTSAYTNACDAWNDDAGADVLITGMGTTTDTSDTSDDLNITQYTASTSDASVLAVAGSWTTGTDLVDCDIQVFGANGSGTIDWSTDSSGAGSGEYDLQLTLTHEIGHCLGLAHSTDSDAIMYAYQADGTGTAERALDPDDSDGLVAIYGGTAAELVFVDYVIDDDGSGQSSGDGDGDVEAGEKVELDIEVENTGTLDASSVTARLSESSAYLSVSDSTISFGTVAARDSETSADDSDEFVFTVASTCTANFTATFTLAMTASGGGSWTDTFTMPIICDRDGDGVGTAEDCDDTRADVYEGADEQCDNVDNDCDGQVDEDPVDATTWYRDQDGDGAGDPARTMESCTLPSGYTRDRSDCDDRDADVHPGADEYCNDIDDDCDDEVDEDDAVDADRWFADEDADGFGDEDARYFACSQPDGYVDDATDCDDGDEDVHPGATERCNDDDDDCDGDRDEGGVCDGQPGGDDDDDDDDDDDEWSGNPIEDLAYACGCGSGGAGASFAGVLWVVLAVGARRSIPSPARRERVARSAG